MQSLAALLGNSLVSGTVAGAASAAVLAVLAKFEGVAPIQTINASSHWLHGESAGQVKDVDVKHSGTGLATHCGACIFWATLSEALRARALDAGPRRIVRDAAVVSTIAATVDYGLMPKRLTPGWEEPLPIRSVAGGFAGLALGLALGGLVAQRLGRY